MVVGKKTLKSYGFKSIEDYFYYIVTSQVMGNFSQLRELIKKLSNEQRKDFLKFIENNEIKFNYTGLF